MRTIDRKTYDKLISGEYSLFEAASSFRETLSLNLNEPHSGHHLVALVFCLDFWAFDVDDVAFIEHFVEAGVGTAAQAIAIQEVSDGVRSSLVKFTTSLGEWTLSLEHIDGILNLMD